MLRFNRRNAWLTWTAGVSAVVSLGLGGALIAEKAKERTRWQVVYREDFTRATTESLAETWAVTFLPWATSELLPAPIGRGRFAVRGGAIHILGDNGYTDLAYRGDLLGGVRRSSLLFAGRFDDVLADFPDDRHGRAEALLGLGRAAEVEAVSDDPAMLARAMLAGGRLDELETRHPSPYAKLYRCALARWISGERPRARDQVAVIMAGMFRSASMRRCSPGGCSVDSSICRPIRPSIPQPPSPGRSRVPAASTSSGSGTSCALSSAIWTMPPSSPSPTVTSSTSAWCSPRRCARIAAARPPRHWRCTASMPTRRGRPVRAPASSGISWLGGSLP